MLSLKSLQVVTAAIVLKVILLRIQSWPTILVVPGQSMFMLEVMLQRVTRILSLLIVKLFVLVLAQLVFRLVWWTVLPRRLRAEALGLILLTRSLDKPLSATLRVSTESMRTLVPPPSLLRCIIRATAPLTRTILPLLCCRTASWARSLVQAAIQLKWWMAPIATCMSSAISSIAALGVRLFLLLHKARWLPRPMSIRFLRPSAHPMALKWNLIMFSSLPGSVNVFKALPHVPSWQVAN